MKKISIKREQSQAGLSFAEREKFRPQVKNKLLLLLVLLAAVVSGAWAADGIECSASDIGKVICTDGSIYAKVSDVPTGKTAAAMIAYIDMENKNGLALALSDEGSMTWSDAKTACEGKSAVAGGTWVLPSKEQWEAMGAVNSTSATALRDGFSSVGGTNMQSGAYWSSTANDANDNKAWRYYFTTGFYWENNVNKTVNNYVRACLTFNILVAPPTYTVTLAEGTEDANKWTISPNPAPAGSPVTATYSGDKKVKSVKAVKKAAASTPLDNTTTAWTAGTFAVPAGGLTYSDAITVSGDVTLTLTDGTTLTLNKGISLASGATLTIQGNGTMNVNGTNESTASTVAGSGTLVLTSGTLNAKGGNGGGYGDREAVSGSKQAGGVAINGAVTVSGGTLTATGGAGGSIGDSNASVTAGAGGAAISGSVTLVSGTLTATGGNGGNGGDHSDGTAGAGGAAIGGNLTVNGGTMTTTNGSNGSEIGRTAVNLGAGGKAVAGTVTDNR